MLSTHNHLGREVSVDTLRIPGILQRLAFTYLVIGMMEVFTAQDADIHQVWVHYDGVNINNQFLLHPPL